VAGGRLEIRLCARACRSCRHLRVRALCVRLRQTNASETVVMVHARGLSCDRWCR
jgi:hypothetical protein